MHVEDITRSKTQVIEARSRTRGKPLFSIILCTYNRRNLVLSALASLRRQTLPYDQFEVIVIDNGSTDGTLNATRAYVNAGSHHGLHRSELWQVTCLSEPRNGAAYARETGLKTARGEIAVFIDDDTLADPHMLEHLLKAYEETEADAIGGRVEIRWEAPRPHWLPDDLLDMLGYFAPSKERLQLQDDITFSSSNFSVKMDALRTIGYFSPFLSKRMHQPTNMDVHDLCQRLRKAGYSIWYDPDVAVAHRASADRLQRAFFIGKAYWQGRSEAMSDYIATLQDGQPPQKYTAVPQIVWDELRDILHLAFVQRPLLHFARKPSHELLLAQMEQARTWGHVRQQLQFLEHAPTELSQPAILCVRSPIHDPSAELFVRALNQQAVTCTFSHTDIPLSWLWQYRAYEGQPLGIIHFYQPGSLNLSPKQRQQLWLRLWLARQLGIRIVTTDTGGWWQGTRTIQSISHRTLERKLMQLSDVILTHTRQPDQLYPDRKLRRHVRSLPHPGFRGYYNTPLPRVQAHQHLGLPAETGFVYLCFAHKHTEQEILQLIEAFSEVGTQVRSKQTHLIREPQLLLVGSPADKDISQRILKKAALNSTLHLWISPATEDDMPLYLGAADAVVIPHSAITSAGMLETAMLALSYERVVIAPSLPRFTGMLPPHASVYYDPLNRTSLVQAMGKAHLLSYSITTKEANALDIERSWEEYAQRVVKIYKQLLTPHQ